MGLAIAFCVLHEGENRKDRMIDLTWGTKRNKSSPPAELRVRSGYVDYAVMYTSETKRCVDRCGCS